MAKLTLGQKADRVLKLLLGLRNPRTLGALMQRGFKEADLEEGWRLLRSQWKVAFDIPAPPTADPSQLDKLDEWENRWFPLAEATLRRRFPVVRDRVFLNLSQTEGPAVIVSVGTFVERVTALRDADEDSQKASKLLSERGLTNSVLDEARALLKELGLPAGAPLQNLEKLRADALAAEAELWSWYLEWSQIARTVVTDRRLLRELGFLRPVQGGASDGDDETEEELEEDPLDVQPAAPTPTATGVTTKIGMPGSSPFTE